MDEKELITKSVEDLIRARGEFFDVLDKIVPKVNGTQVFDFDACDDANLKEIYAKFYAYDYAIRKILPQIYAKFNIKFNV